MPRTVRSRAQSRGRRVRARLFMGPEARSPGLPLATLVVKIASGGQQPVEDGAGRRPAGRRPRRPAARMRGDLALVGFLGARRPAPTTRGPGPQRFRLRAGPLVAALL